MKAVKEIDLKLIANLKHFKVEIGTRKTNIASLLVQGAVAGITIKKNDTVVNAKLKDIVILDPLPETIHPKLSVHLGFLYDCQLDIALPEICGGKNKYNLFKN